ncbi:hypothetical protein KFL_001140260 [Klebsormidium nitens]|uniref:Uncharacterized protein n=1 Tax=Klebsormidium nitens TaxID=105231 RepID=A0A1Y1I340_KLENI|nr:hypothetical protein KFL_001140260 [Klebsormidium nitens]|eukprot:GAQ82538.1 hypothetical protein KFL_001140260 [Klebsormidium nitens]
MASQVATQCCTVTGLAGARSLGSAHGLPEGLKVSPVMNRKVQRSARKSSIVAMVPKKKVNAYDEAWTKSFFGTGYFAESSETAGANIIQSLEKKKLLSGIEKAGVLSKLEGAGLSLSTIEKLGLLSKAEKFGLLSLVENLAGTNPGVIASYALPLFAASIASIVFIPDDTTVLLALQYTLAVLCLAGAGGAFVTALVLGALQD